MLSDIDPDAPTETMFKQDMRRIGETNTQRLSVSTFSLAPYYQSASKLNQNYLLIYMIFHNLGI